MGNIEFGGILVRPVGWGKIATSPVPFSLAISRVKEWTDKSVRSDQKFPSSYKYHTALSFMAGSDWCDM